MSYQIRYLPLKGKRKLQNGQIRLMLLTTLSFILFYVLVKTQWQEGSELLYVCFQHFRADIEQAVQVISQENSLPTALSDAFIVLIS